MRFDSIVPRPRDDLAQHDDSTKNARPETAEMQAVFGRAFIAASTGYGIGMRSLFKFAQVLNDCNEGLSVRETSRFLAPQKSFSKSRLN